MTIRIPLSQTVFGLQDVTVLDHPNWKITAFCYVNGIAGLRIKGARVEAVILPFRGQQVWSLAFDGESVGMRGMTSAPADGAGLVDSFGAFFFHCGLMGTSAPGIGDNYPQHGELPVAPMSEAWLEFEDLSGDTLTLRSRCTYARVFRAHYVAAPFVRFAHDAAAISIGIEVENKSKAEMPFMYMGHPNFRPIDGARLAYSAPYTTAAVRVYTPVPTQGDHGAGHRGLVERLVADPLLHHHLDQGLPYDPEVVFEIDYLADENGWAHSLQIHPDGTSDGVSHQTASCPRALRWISRTADLDAIAIVEPATSWLGGYTAEKSAGTVPSLAAGVHWRTEIRVERLSKVETTMRLDKIDSIAGRSNGAAQR